jgi:hypothetical protein
VHPGLTAGERLPTSVFRPSWIRIFGYWQSSGYPHTFILQKTFKDNFNQEFPNKKSA